MNHPLTYLRNLLGEDDTIVKEILMEMKKQWQIDTLDIKSAITSQDPYELMRVLHRAKSTFAPLGPQNKVYLLFLTESSLLKNISAPTISDYESFASKLNEALREIFKYITTL